VELHGGSWRVHASSVDDISKISDAIKWISGGSSEIIEDRGKSSIGARLTTIKSRMSRKSALVSLKMIPKSSWVKMSENGLIEKIDDEGVIHLRLDLSKLVVGEVEIAPSVFVKRVVKGKFKIAHFPGEEMNTVAKRLFGILSE
tara:strand:- start:369 stop:800 length:432 start_codon:yes stop_codon:yes gene_type:complete